MEHKEVKQHRISDSTEPLVMASVAEYNTWLVYNYLEMDLLVKLLKGRRPNQPWDISFENKVLWALVHSNENYEVKADPSKNYELIRLFLIKYNRGDQDLLDFKKGESAKFPGALRGLLMSLAGHLELKTNFPCLRQMDKGAISHMLPFLATQEQVSLFSTCKAMHEKSVLIKPINKLLSLVARGEQDKAEAMIRENPKLLLQSGDITDGAGRYFKNITPLQYAVWALDAHMWTMMLPLFPDAVYIDQDGHWFTVAATHQLRALEEKGTEHGRHFDFKPLLEAYAAYNLSPSEERWCRGIGDQQRLLPDHIVQELMTPDQIFQAEDRDFMVHGGRPSVHDKRGVKWWQTFIANHRGGLVGSVQTRHGNRRYGSVTFPLEPFIISSGMYEVGIAEPYRWFSVSFLTGEGPVVQALCLQRSEDLRALQYKLFCLSSPPAESKSPGRR